MEPRRNFSHERPFSFGQLRVGCKCKSKGGLICMALYYELLISKAVRYGTCKKRDRTVLLPTLYVYPQVE